MMSSPFSSDLTKHLTNYKRHLSRAIGRYDKEVVKPVIQHMYLSLGVQILYYILLFVFIILTNLQPSLGSIIGAVGLGGLGAYANWEKFHEKLNRLLSDRLLLKQTVVTLKQNLNLCRLDPMTEEAPPREDATERNRAFLEYGENLKMIENQIKQCLGLLSSNPEKFLREIRKKPLNTNYYTEKP